MTHQWISMDLAVKYGSLHGHYMPVFDLAISCPNLLEPKQEFTENYEWVSASIDSSSDRRSENYDGFWKNSLSSIIAYNLDGVLSEVHVNTID